MMSPIVSSLAASSKEKPGDLQLWFPSAMEETPLLGRTLLLVTEEGETKAETDVVNATTAQMIGMGVCFIFKERGLKFGVF